ncbi:MAG: hypothetical protein WKF45_02225 [Ilumatobacteraceae bacterium]
MPPSAEITSPVIALASSGEERDDLGDLVGRRQPAGRDHAEDGVRDAWLGESRHISVSTTPGGVVRTDPLRAVLHRQQRIIPSSAALRRHRRCAAAPRSRLSS